MGIWRVTITADFYAQACQNVLHFDGGDTGPTAQEVFIEVRDQWIGTAPNVGIKSWVPNSIRWIAIAVQERVPGPGPTQTFPINVPGQQGASNEMFLQNTIILRFPTAVGGRSGRGRSYTPGVMAGFTTNGFLDDTFTAFAGPALQNLRLRFLRSSVQHGPLVLGVALRSNSAAFKDVVDILASPITGTQRRRNVGRGI